MSRVDKGIRYGWGLACTQLTRMGIGYLSQKTEQQLVEKKMHSSPGHLPSRNTHMRDFAKCVHGRIIYHSVILRNRITVQ